MKPARCFQLNSHLSQPCGYHLQNLGVRVVRVIEAGGVHQDNVSTTVGMETPDGLYRRCSRFQAGAYRSLRFCLPGGSVHEL